jgi:Predicted Zn-dependent protease (DUF2268)
VRRIACLVIVLPFGAAAAQSATGAWEGVVGGQRVLVTLDSGASGWHGRLFAPSWRADTMQLTAVAVHGDSVVLRLPAHGGAILRGSLSGDRQQAGGIVFAGTDTIGAFRLARAGTPAAARLLAQLDRPPPGPRRSYQDPDSARLITSDITLFWDVLARAPADSLEEWLEREYLARGTPGLRDFIPGRILSAADLALQVRRRRARYDAVRSSTLRVSEAEPGIRAALRALKELYPEAAYPDVYFVIGRFNSGGTASANGLLIGAEMYDDPARLPAIVAHELIHFQQGPLSGPRTLLAQSFREGAANFVGEMISGVHINSEAHRYGKAHERELWKEFKERMRGTDYTGWLYGDPPGERPADMGYFVGYRIAQAYYDKAADKRAALRDIIRGTDVEGIVARSGYDP